MEKRQFTRYCILAAWAVVIAGGVASSVMFAAQGGFGRGHRALDLPLFVLALPWVLVPWDIVAEPGDYVRFAVLPFACNCVLCAALQYALRVWSQRRP